MYQESTRSAHPTAETEEVHLTIDGKLADEEREPQNMLVVTKDPSQAAAL